MSGFTFLFKGQHLQLLPKKAIFWEEKQALILSDLHLGKSAHFRKAGIALPVQVAQEDLFCLQHLIMQYHPQQIIITGDLFHSEMNHDWNYFKLWRNQFSTIFFHLVKGNHDILQEEMYAALNIETHEYLLMEPFLFVHDKAKSVERKAESLSGCVSRAGKKQQAKNNEVPIHHSSLTTHHYCISGHIHPAIKMKGSGKQSLQLPCYYFGKNEAILPAFGYFTGTITIKILPDDKVFVIAKEKVMQL